MTKKIILAYSGGLDTSVMIPWLKENYKGTEIVAVTVNLGQPEDLTSIKNAIQITADKIPHDFLFIGGRRAGQLGRRHALRAHAQPGGGGSACGRGLCRRGGPRRAEGVARSFQRSLSLDVAGGEFLPVFFGRIHGA